MVFQKIKIVADSTCDLPKELVQKWDIRIIPTYVNYDGNSYADDGVELDRREFYKLLPEMSEFPTTSAPSPGLAEEILTEALRDADHLVCILLPEKMSATLNNARLGAQRLPQQQITIIDSTNYSIATGLQALVAAETAAETGDLSQVLNAIQQTQQKVKFFVAVASLDYLRRSGRINPIMAGVGSLLQVKPILTAMDGEIIVATRARTFKKALDTLRKLAEEQAPLDRLVIGHVNNEPDALRLKEQLRDIAPERSIIVEIGPTIAAHIGPGIVGVVTLSSK